MVCSDFCKKSSVGFTVVTLFVLLLTAMLGTPTADGFMLSLSSSPKAKGMLITTALHHHHHHHGHSSRRQVLRTVAVAVVLSSIVPESAIGRTCTDIESCREIGERKVEKDLKENPVLKLDCGARYKVLQAGTGETVVRSTGSSVDMIYSVSMMSTGYMYSRGFGNEKINVNGKMIPDDAGLDSYRVTMGQRPRQIPLAIEEALVGMKRGERRRVEVPPKAGLETSNWQPAPATSTGKAKLAAYQRLLTGTNSQPAFPAATIWDIEVLNIRN